MPVSIDFFNSNAMLQQRPSEPWLQPIRTGVRLLPRRNGPRPEAFVKSVKKLIDSAG
jgi:hypothetical protein